MSKTFRPTINTTIEQAARDSEEEGMFWPDAEDPNRHCIGEVMVHSVLLPYAQQCQRHYATPTFGITHLLSNHELTQNGITWLDEDLLKHLKLAVQEPTVVLVMGDHGPQFGKYSTTEFGFFDHRNPLMVMLAPLTHLTHVQVQALSVNQQQIVSAYDFYETLKDVPYLTCFESATQQRKTSRQGRSLFNDLPSNRSCADAGIPPQWCVDRIFEQRSVDLSISEKETLIMAVVDALNDRLIDFQAHCRWFRAEDFRIVSSSVSTYQNAERGTPELDTSFEAHIIIEETSGGISFQATCLYTQINAHDQVTVTLLGRKSQYAHEKCVPAHVKQFCACAR